MKSNRLARPLAFLGAAFLILSSLFWFKIAADTRAAMPAAEPLFQPKSVETMAELLKTMRP